MVFFLFKSTESFLIRQLCDMLTFWSAKIGIAQCDPLNGDNYILVSPSYVLISISVDTKIFFAKKKCFKKSNSPSMYIVFLFSITGHNFLQEDKNYCQDIGTTFAGII